MGITTKSLGDLINYINSEQLKLPEIQREFVWKRGNIEMLFDSLYRDLPIGQMLVWKPKDLLPVAKPFHRKARPRFSLGLNQPGYGYLLDGQQRLTAISRVREADEEYPLMVDLWSALETDEDIFYWNRRMEESSPWYLPVSDVLSPDFDITAHLKRLEKDAYYKPNHAEIVRKALTRLQGILAYQVSVIEYESERHRDATELFIRFNSTGKKLNKNDLALAELASRVEGLSEAEISRAMNKWKGFRFTRPFLVQCLAAVHTGRMNLRKPEEVWGNSSSEEIKESWRKTERALGEVIEFITGTVHWNSDSWLPSFNALIPLIYVYAKNGKLNLSERRLARTWLVLSGVKAYFSGSVYTELDQLLRKLASEPTIERLWEITRKKLGKIRSEDFETGRQSGAVMSFFISMLRDDNAKDWLNDTPLDGTVIGRNAQLHVHHFFPRALLGKYDQSYNHINTFANYTILSASTNFDIGTEEPASYLKRLSVQKKELAAQCIPVSSRLWRVSRYDDFLRERKRMLVQHGNEFLGL